MSRTFDFSRENWQPNTTKHEIGVGEEQNDDARSSKSFNSDSYLILDTSDISGYSDIANLDSLAEFEEKDLQKEENKSDVNVDSDVGMKSRKNSNDSEVLVSSDSFPPNNSTDSPISQSLLALSNSSILSRLINERTQSKRMLCQQWMLQTPSSSITGFSDVANLDSVAEFEGTNSQKEDDFNIDCGDIDMKLPLNPHDSEDSFSSDIFPSSADSIISINSMDSPISQSSRLRNRRSKSKNKSMFEKETVSPSAKLRILQDNLPKKKNSENNVNVQLKDKTDSTSETFSQCSINESQASYIVISSSSEAENM